MDRRHFLAGGYSLVVLADRLAAAPPQGWRDEIGRHFQRIAPPRGQAAPLPAEPHMTLVDLEADVLVAGGGLAGVCAAVAAARHGARVVLVQDRSRLGGNSSSEVKMHVVGANCHKGRPGWREGGLIEEFRLDDAANNPQRCWELWDLLLYDKVISEKNITLLLDSTLYSARVENGRIQEVHVRCDKSEHIYRIRAKIFIDSTGDSRLGLEAGAAMRTGREARREFDEPLAPVKADTETLGSSILFTSRLYHSKMPFAPPQWARKVTREDLRFRKIDSWEYGYWWIEWGGNLDIIQDNERIRFELLSIVMGVWDYIKNSGDFPDSANWALDWVGMMPGRRGSRRLIGDHIMTQREVTAGDYEDAVAIGGWPMDDHPPGGFDRSDLPPNTVLRTAEVFNIPFRALYSRDIANLMMAGRNISASHVVFTSTRVMGTCAAVGQAAGTAAAQCSRDGIVPRELWENRNRLLVLQQTLLRDDQTIRGGTNQDPLDLARRARVTASGERSPARAILVIDGHLRDIPGREIHHWEAPLEAGGAWLELTWNPPVRLRHIQVTFDTGFQRELTLSASDTVTRGIVRAPQPETVRDYSVTCRAVNGNSLASRSVQGNHQRVNRHTLEPAVEVQSLRIHITATNGDPLARLFEVRCYA